MRLYRMCEHEGRLDMGAYIALRESVTIGEALEIEAALCVIGDFREEYSDFRANWEPAIGPVAGSVQVSAEDLRAELKHRETALERAQAARMRHRAAIAYVASGQPEPPGRLTVAAISAVDAAIASHEGAISYLRSKLETMSNGD